MSSYKSGAPCSKRHRQTQAMGVLRTAAMCILAAYAISSAPSPRDTFVVAKLPGKHSVIEFDLWDLQLFNQDYVVICTDVLVSTEKKKQLSK